MNKLKFVIISNPFKDQEYSKYDYLGQFVSNGTKTLDDVSSSIVENRPHIDSSFMQMAVGLFFEVVADEIADNYRCSIGGIAFASAISGSFPAANSPFSDNNELYVAVTVGDPLRSTVAALVPEKDSEESVKVVINNVEDKASHEVGVIHGTSAAIVTGKNMSATQTDESIVLADLDTLVTKAVGTVVAQDGLGQRLEVSFAAPFAAGKYWLLLKTRGYATPDAAVETYRKKVSVNPGAVVPTGPVVSKGYSSTHESDIGGIYDGEAFYLEGERLTDATVKAKYTSGGTEHEDTAPAEFLTVTASKITLDSAFISGFMPGVETGATVVFTVSNSLGSTSYYATKRA